MKCLKCNQEIPEGSAYCPKCGEKVVVQEEKDNDKNTTSENKQESGFKKIIIEKWNGLNGFNKLCVTLYGVFGIALIVSLLFSKVLPGIISIIQLGGLTFAFLIEKGKINAKKDWYKYVLIVICILLSYCYIIVFSSNSNIEEPKIDDNYSDTSEEIDWSELVIGDKIPELSGHKGRIITNTDTKMNIYLSDITNKEYYDYLEECRKKGYTINEVKDDYSFDASSEENLELNLRFYSSSNELNIKLSPFEKETKPENVIDTNTMVKSEEALNNTTDVGETSKTNNVQQEKEKKEEKTAQEQPKKEEQPKPEQKEPEADGKISIPKAASSFKYEKYQDVLTGFTSLGFTNVKTNVIYDVGNGWLSSTSAGDVKEVSINGNNNFNAGDRFDKNAEVVITYRDFETNVPDTNFTKYTVNKLEQDLDTNPLNAKEAHNNELVEITGKLSNIDSSGKYITLERTDQTFNLRTISCHIKNDEQKEKIKNMTVGKTVTVRGKITSIGEVLGYSMDIYSIP